MMDKKIDELEKPSSFLGMTQYLLVYASIFIVFLMHFHYDLFSHPFFYMMSIIFIAGRQHSLYILNHDASHGSLFKCKKLNRWVSTLLSVAPMFHHPEAWSFVQWKRIHLCHHGYLFSVNDPNYVSGKNAGDTLTALTRSRLIIKCLLSPPRSVYQFIFGSQDYCPRNSNHFKKNELSHIKALFPVYDEDPEMNSELFVKWVFFLITSIFLISFDVLIDFALLWIIPMYTIYPMILKFFDLTEHYWESDSKNPLENTRSSYKGFFSRIILSLLHRGLHREHHLFPRVPAIRLPRLSRLLQQETRG